MSESPFQLVVGVSPNTPPEALAALLAARVAEVFVGYVPRRWLARYGAETSPNRRHFADRQILDRDALARLAEQVRGAGVALTVALNEHHHPPDAGDLLAEIVADALAAGATGFIAADLETLAFLTGRVPAGTALVLSNEAAAFNAEAALRYARAGATRVVFPREMKVSEMEALASVLRPAGVALEAFVAREYCPNSSSLCYTTHGYRRPVHFCYAHERQTLWDLRGAAPPRELPTWPAGWSMDPAFMQALATWHRCGLCAIARLGRIGVRHLKVPGRSASALPAVLALRELLDAGDLSEAACRAKVATPAFCEGEHHCYYDLADVRGGTCAVGAQALDTRGATAETASTNTSARPPEVGLALAVALPPEACTAADLARLQAGGLAALAAGDAPADGGPPLAPWERDALARTLAVLTAAGLDTARAPARVLLDCEACLLRWPRAAALERRLRAIADAGFEAALVLPVVFQSGWSEVWDTLAALAARDVPFALVVNDLGMLEAAARLGRPVETGRIWNRMKRDQLAHDPSVLPSPLPDVDVDPAALAALRDAQTHAHGAPYLVRGAHARLLREHAVARVGFDVLATPLTAPLDPAFAYSFWGPWTYVTSSRACPRAVALEGASPAHPTERCRRGCVDEALVHAYPWRHEATIRHGAALFVDTSTDLAAFLASAPTPRAEVVVTPRVPR